MVTRFGSGWIQTRSFPAWKVQLIDAKMDDGLPFTGIVYHSANWNCIVGWPTNAYAVTAWPHSNLCAVKFVILN